MKSAIELIPLLLVPCVMGCWGGDGVKRSPVSGEVKVDGEPLKEGTIDFFPAEANPGPSAGGVIENGKYDIPKVRGPIIGKHRVEIHGNKYTGRKVPNAMGPDGMMDEIVEALPPEVNIDSKLVREIIAGQNTIDFTDLKGAPPPKPRKR